MVTFSFLPSSGSGQLQVKAYYFHSFLDPNPSETHLGRRSVMHSLALFHCCDSNVQM